LAVVELGRRKKGQPTAVCLDTRAPAIDSEIGRAGAGYDGAKQRKGSNVHIAVELAYVDQGYT